MFPALKPLSIIMGLIYMGMTAGFLVVRQMLAGFRKNAVRCLLGSLVFGCILSIVFLVLNRIYFDNREELFVN